MRKLLPAFGALLLLGAGAWWVERLHVTDEERVEAAYDALRAAVQDEDGGALEALITSDFSWSGPRPIGEGERGDVVGRFEEFWAVADGVGILPRGSKEIAVAGGIATLNVPQIVRFRYGQQLIAYKVTTKMTFDRAGEGFVLARIDVTELKPGIL